MVPCLMPTICAFGSAGWDFLVQNGATTSDTGLELRSDRIEVAQVGSGIA